MPIERAQVQHIAALARIALTEETDAFARQLPHTLEQFEALQRLDTGSVAPAAYAAGLGFDDGVYRAVRLVAAKWCAEPSVHGGKARPPGAVCAA